MARNDELDAEVERVLRQWAYAWGATIEPSHPAWEPAFKGGHPANDKSIAFLAAGLRASLHSGDYILMKRDLNEDRA